MRVLLVDDQILFRKGLRALLASEDDMEVVSEAANGREALDKVKAFRPDVVLMDINMPVCDGIEATRLLKAEHPEIKVVILTVSDEDDDLFEAIKAGAEGYLLKNLRPEELTQMLRSVMANEAPVSPAIASKLLGEFRRRPRHDEAPTAGAELTSREREVLQLVADGMSNAEIGLRLCVVEGTVKNHLHNILEKLHLQNRVQAAAYAMRAGIVSLPPRG
ncbi:MAG: response regulator transcription factor [Chloroflexota bacterium]|nr:response regulator transcription factor [Chloroflexota bacterium]